MSFHLPNSINRQFRLRSKANGFTMIELMITMVIGILLTAVALPQYTNFVQAQKSNGEVTNLYSDMQFARAEALKEGQTVSVCTSSNLTSCTGTNWSQGWLVFSDPSALGVYTAGTGQELLKAQTGFTTTDTVLTLNAPTTNVAQYLLQFNRNGYAVNVSSKYGLLFEVHTTSSNGGSTRCLWVSAIGNQYIQKPSSTAQSGQGGNVCA